MERTGRAVALDQRHDRSNVASATANLGPRLATNVGHVCFERPAFAAHRRGRTSRSLHDFADAVHQVPSRVHAAIERALDLAGADALFASDTQLNRLEP